MKVRFQADADLKHAIVRATLRREPTIDFRSAASADLAGRDDMEVLAIAAREGRVLVLMTAEQCRATSLSSLQTTRARVSSSLRSG
jgi:hypothetical protein